MSPEERRKQMVRAVVASTVGTSIEWYDYFLFGTMAGLVHARSGSAGDLDCMVGDVIDRANRATKARRSPIRGGAVPSKVMIDLATEQGVNGSSTVRHVACA